MLLCSVVVTVYPLLPFYFITGKLPLPIVCAVVDCYSILLLFAVCHGDIDRYTSIVGVLCDVTNYCCIIDLFYRFIITILLLICYLIYCYCYFYLIMFDLVYYHNLSFCDIPDVFTGTDIY